MNSEKAEEVAKDLVKLFKSPGNRLEATKPVVRSGPQDARSEVYEYRSPGGQIYLVTFKQYLGEVSIIVEPPVGELICAQTPAQADFLVVKVKTHLEVERKALDPAMFARKTVEKILA